MQSTVDSMVYVHPTAVCESQRVGEGTRIWAFAHVLDGAVVGQRKMGHWDDVDPTDTLRVYDKGLDEPPYYDSFGEFQFLLRKNDVHLPKIHRCEPLVNQGKAFLDTVLDGTQCPSGAAEAAAVVCVLEAATRSLQNGGRCVPCICPLCASVSAFKKEL